jgi:uncharacterized membrane protein
MIRIRSIVALITHIVIIIKKPAREGKARIWAVVSLKEEEEEVMNLQKAVISYSPP